MITNLAFYLILGIPLVGYLGVITFLLILFTATVGALNMKGISVIPFKWHPRLAITTIIFATVHGILGASIIFHF